MRGDAVIKIVAVDQQPEELIRLSVKLRRITPPGTSVECFSDPLYAYQYAFHHGIDVFFVVAQMGRMTGLELTERMRGLFPAARIFVLWRDEDFRQEALRLGADGYLLTPVTVDTLREAMEDAEIPDGGAERAAERDEQSSQKKKII